jgi:murein DD-endopeptidase MepM/ murein hydrolase activator NlpD
MEPPHRPPPRFVPSSARGGPATLALPVLLVLLVLLALLVLSIVVVISAPPRARAAGTGQLQQRIAGGRRRVSGLAGAVAAADRRVAALNSSISALSGQLVSLQSDLDAKRTELLALRSQLSDAQAKLRRLEASEAADQRVLARQLIGAYEAGSPDIVGVVLASTGFNDLLERLNFAERVGHQDAQIVGGVKAARRAVAMQAIHLGTLSARQQQLTDQILSERNRAGAVRLNLLSQELAAARDRAAKAGQLTSAKTEVASLTGQLSRLQAAQRAAAAPRAPAGQSSGSSGQTSSSAPPSHAPGSPVSGGFEFPMPKADVSPPSTWSLDDGVDIAAPGGTPELAVCSGTLVLHGIGGFGPSAPVIHCDHPLAGYDYVYYGHAGPGDWVPIGTHLAPGQVISQVGYGDVGISTGPHLELGFADSSGSPIGPSSAPAMMSLLRGAYAG